MKICILQTDIIWASPQANIARAEALMEQYETADLYVLPEMWATGFATEPEGTAEDERKSLALEWMRTVARRQNCALSGSLAVRTADGSFRNRHYFVTPDAYAFYDKHHLFTYGHEDRYFTAGKEAVVVEWKEWRLLLQTCYDLRFPCFARYGRWYGGDMQAAEEQQLRYDAIIYVANWPEKRQMAWDTLIRARAIENQCYVVAVNRTGQDPVCSYSGGSAIVDPKGHTVAECRKGEHLATAMLSIEKLREMRSRFRVLDDRDRFSL